MGRSWRLGLLACSALAGLVPGVASAQSSSGLEEIVVTAQKREENLQKVPISVSAFSAETLENYRVTDVKDLQGLSPNLVIKDQGSPGVPTFAIRGITSGTSEAVVDPKVGLYLDGVYIGRSVGAVFDLADIQRVEVLRGPQGTLFGRNATGGAISLVTAAPTGQFGIKQDLGYGNYGAFRARTTIDLPAWGNLSVKVNYLHDQRRGYQRNLGAGLTLDLRPLDPQLGVLTAGKWFGKRNTDAVQAAVKLDASDDISFIYRFDYTDSHATAAPVQAFGFVGGAGGAAAAQIYAAQPLVGGRGVTSITRLSAVDNMSSVEPLTVQGHSLTATWQASDDIQFKSITAYRKYNIGPSTYDISATGGLRLPDPRDADGIAPFAMLGSYRKSSQHQFSEEFQVVIDKDLYNLTTGAFYFHERSPQLDGLLNFATLPNNTAVSDPAAIRETIATNSAKAVFAQGTIHVTEQFDVTGGVRQSWDDRKTNLVRIGSNGASPLAKPPGVYNSDFTHTDWTGILTYRPVEDITTYAKVNTGYVAGGIMSGTPYGPEELTAYEVGVKSELFDKRLRANVDGFYMNYKGIQVQDFSKGFQIFQNAAKARSYGLEAELEAAPIENLTLQASTGYTHFKYKQFIDAVTGLDVSDSRHQPYMPKWTLRLAANYDFAQLPVGGGVPYIRMDGRWQSKAYAQVVDSGNALLDDNVNFNPYWNVTGRLGIGGLAFGEVTANISVYVQNMLNKREIAFAPNLGTVVAGTFIEPRTYGLDLSLKF